MVVKIITLVFTADSRVHIHWQQPAYNDAGFGVGAGFGGAL